MQEYLPKYASVSISLEKVSFNEPVMVNLLNGNVYDLSKALTTNAKGTFIEDVPLADFPMVILERKSLKLF